MPPPSYIINKMAKTTTYFQGPIHRYIGHPPSSLQGDISSILGSESRFASDFWKKRDIFPKWYWKIVIYPLEVWFPQLKWLPHFMNLCWRLFQDTTLLARTAKIQVPVMPAVDFERRCAPVGVTGEGSNFRPLKEVIWEKTSPPKRDEFPLKRDHFKRIIVFQPSMFRGYVTFEGG